MFKKIVISLITFAVTLSILLAIFIKPVTKFVFEKADDLISYLIEEQEREWQEAIERGEIIPGRDTMLIWNNQYEMLHGGDGDGFFIHYKDGLIDKIVDKVTEYKKKNEKLFILSEEGYVTVDENDLCKVYVTVPKEEFVSGYSMDDYGNKKYFSRFIEHEKITYLKSFDEFTEEEKKVFNKMEK